MFKNVPVVHQTTHAGAALRLETGLLARQANATVLASHGDTTVMVNVVVGPQSDRDYFPLQVIYEEKLYASGKIKGSRFIKREGRPSETAVLTGRMVDRSIRSLFDQETRSEIQVIVTVLSLDEIHQPDTLAVLGASSALKIATGEDFMGPVSSIRISRHQTSGKQNLMQTFLKFDQTSYNQTAVHNLLQDASAIFDIKNPEDKESITRILTHLKELDSDILENFKTIYKSANRAPESKALALRKYIGSEASFVFSPTYDQMKNSDLDLVISGDGHNIMMLEAGANILDESQVSKALDVAKSELLSLNQFQNEFIQLASDKLEIEPVGLNIRKSDPKAQEYWLQVRGELEELLYLKAQKQAKSEAFKGYIKEHLEVAHNLYKTFQRLKSNNPDMDYQNLKIQTLEILDALESKYDQLEKITAPMLLDLATNENQLGDIVKSLDASLDKVVKQIMKENIFTKSLRFDHRPLDKTRQIDCQVNVLPQTHGSSLFSRGETQVLNILTLGTVRDAQTIDEMEDFEETTKRYMHHYNFPAYSVGETGRYTGPGRREIGHGALAEKALLPVLPSEDDFPYTIRLVSECLGSNGSTSMASTCGSCLSLMDGGVPIKDMVAGVAMGLVLNSETGDFRVLTDIQGIEDHYGDMDFKVTGTKDGITAIQLDNKVAGLTIEILKEAIVRSKEARLHILDIMNQTISKPREQLSKTAPIVLQTLIPEDKVGDVIGPSGKIIKAMIAEFKVEIDIQDDGRTYIFGKDLASAKAALNRILSITKEFEVGEIVDGEVVKIESYGAFVRLGGSGKDGMVHISEIKEERIKDINEYLKMGQKLKVKIIGFNDAGKINLSLKGVE